MLQRSLHREDWGSVMSDPVTMIKLDNQTEARFIKISQGLKKRHAASQRLRNYGVLAIVIAIGFLAILLTTIVSNGYTALKQTELQVEVTLPLEKDRTSVG